MQFYKNVIFFISHSVNRKEESGFFFNSFVSIEI